MAEIDKTATFILRLYLATKNDRIKWEKTVEDNTFQTSFANYSLKINMWDSDDSGYIYVLSIVNSDGIEIARIMPEDVSNFTFEKKTSVAVFRDIYEKARRTALGIEKALDDLIESLNKVNKPDDDKMPPDDDIPF
jgi:hypothetical protein